jgi:hypothetical protein
MALTARSPTKFQTSINTTTRTTPPFAGKRTNKNVRPSGGMNNGV